MPDAHDPPPDGRTQAEWVYELAEEYDAGWEPTGAARMDDLVRRAPRAFAAAVARELVIVDRQRRRNDEHTRIAHARYLSLFPSLAADPAWRGAVENDAMEDAVAAIPDPPQPQAIGRYPVNGSLGKGGEAEVFLCFHPDWKKQVAVKWMHVGVQKGSDWQERFTRQGHLFKQLEHPRIVTVYDQGEHDGRPFLVTEYIDGGRPLEQYYRDKHPIPRPESLRWSRTWPPRSTTPTGSACTPRTSSRRTS